MIIIYYLLFITYLKTLFINKDFAKKKYFQLT